tara:strand:+ start:230 stop:445 length:216 start_codon:yes stop_codon:yes gene_type:complete
MGIMKILPLILTLLLITNCSTHTVKLGKKCTKVASDNTYEKSFVWIVKRETINEFKNKINSENCLKNGEKL